MRKFCVRWSTHGRSDRSRTTGAGGGRGQEGIARRHASPSDALLPLSYEIPPSFSYAAAVLTPQLLISSRSEVVSNKAPSRQNVGIGVGGGCQHVNQPKPPPPPPHRSIAVTPSPTRGTIFVFFFDRDGFFCSAVCLSSS